MNRAARLSAIFLIALSASPLMLAEDKGAKLKNVQRFALASHEGLTTRALNTSFDDILPGAPLNLASPTAKSIAPQIDVQRDLEAQPFGSLAAVLSGIALVAGIVLKRVSR